jgi:hypothetical protein
MTQKQLILVSDFARHDWANNRSPLQKQVILIAKANQDKSTAKVPGLLIFHRIHGLNPAMR